MDPVIAFLGRVNEFIINPLISLLGGAAVIVLLWGIFEFVRNAEDQEKRAQGRDAIMWGFVGLVVIFGAFGIINLAARTFGLGSVQQGLHGDIGQPAP